MVANGAAIVGAIVNIDRSISASLLAPVVFGARSSALSTHDGLERKKPCLENRFNTNEKTRFLTFQIFTNLDCIIRLWRDQSANV